ncbi:hypothetical protein Tco_0866204 [Tanacetum coccineum]
MARIMTITRSGMTPEAIKELITQRVDEALAAQEANLVLGVVGLARWFEKMESVFRISNCPPNSQVKFATCTLLDGALTWWNSHVMALWALRCQWMIDEADD